ncbi:hypothetical protein FRC06_010524, partial [Ceratobasidium sp. 370]
MELDSDMWWIEKIEETHKYTIFNDKHGRFLGSLGYIARSQSPMSCLSCLPDLWTIQSVDANEHFLIKNAYTGNYLGVYRAYNGKLELRLQHDITDEANHWMLAAKE